MINTHDLYTFYQGADPRPSELVDCWVSAHVDMFGATPPWELTSEQYAEVIRVGRNLYRLNAE